MTTLNIVPYPTLDPGIEFEFRGIERDDNDEPIGEMVNITLNVPPLNLRNLRRFGAELGSLSQSVSIAAMQVLVELLVAALRQNYEGVPRWLIEQSINPSNFPDVAIALMDVAGLKRKEVEEKKTAAKTVSPSQTSSTALSPTSV